MCGERWLKLHMNVAGGMVYEDAAAAIHVLGLSLAVGVEEATAC